MVLDPELVALAEVGGELAGITVLIPDANQVFKKMRGRLLPFGLFYLLRRNRIIDRVRLPILGVAPEYRNKGLELVMIHELYQRAMAKGYRRCEASWTLEDNRAMNHVIAAGGAEQDRKSTRLNSSHANISYAVFCLKKKKKSLIYH